MTRHNSPEQFGCEGEERKRVEPGRKFGVWERDFLRIGVTRARLDADEKNPLEGNRSRLEKVRWLVTHIF